MMTLLARGLGWLLGAPKLLAVGALGGLLLMGHQLWLGRDARLHAEGAAKCDASWELAQVKAQRDAAVRAAKTAQDQFEQERQTTEGLRNEHQAINAEFAAHKASASTDPRCLSDGVLDLLRGDGKVGGAR